MSNRLTWLLVATVGVMLVCFMAAMQGAFAQRVVNSYFCDRADQITALVESGVDQQYTLKVVNKHDPTACVQFVGTFLEGKSVAVVKDDRQLYDIVPVLLLKAGNEVLKSPVEQWTALKSLALEAKWIPMGRPPLVPIRYKEEYAQMEPKVRAWFNNQNRPDVGGSCCSTADGSFAEERIQGTHYWTRWPQHPEWMQVPDTVVLHTPNINKAPVVWYQYDEDEFTGERLSNVPQILCYSPGPGM